MVIEQQRSIVSSLEFPVILVAPGLGAAEAVLEELDPAGTCRIRSLRFFSPGSKVEFTFGTAVGRRHVYGRIVGYATPGKRFVYHVQLEEMLASTRERLAEIVAGRRRELADGAFGPAADGIASPPLARASARAEADFDLDYFRTDAWRHATAANLSTGGLLMRASEALVEGMALGMRFTLPTAILECCSRQLAADRAWPPGVLQAARSMLERPFKPLTLRARVVCHRPIAGMVGDYGMEFCDVDAFARREIERYVSALQFAGGRGRIAQFQEAG